MNEMEAYSTSQTAKEFVRAKVITDKISLSVLGHPLHIRIERDVIHSDNGRLFIQVKYISPCSKNGTTQEWRGRKWYLSEYMTDDEIVKTCYAAFEAAVKHEIMEGFKFDGIVVFNPHVNYEELLKISHLEVQRK